MLPACAQGGPARDGAAPSAVPSPAVVQPTDRDPTDAEVRAAVAAYLAATRSEIVQVNVEDHHVGVYVRGNPPWALDEFVTHLPLAAETARELLRLWPAVADVDICGDGPWLPHDEYDDFAPAMRVQLFRDRLPRVPARLATPADVIREGGTTRSIDFYVDQRIVRESAAYREAARAANPRKRSPLPSEPL